MRKILSLVLVLALVFGSFQAFAATNQYEVANELKKLGVIKGDNNGDTMPNKKLTREQAIVILARLMNVVEEVDNTTAAPSFKDVPKGSYYTKYIAFAEFKGWTKGVGNGKFGMGQDTTLQQFMAFMLRALGYGDTPYADTMAKARELGLTKDVMSNKASDKILRGDAFVAMKNTLYTAPNGKKEELIYVIKLAEKPVPAVFALESATADNRREVMIAFNKEVDEKKLDKDNFSINSNKATEVKLQEDGKTVMAWFELDNQKEYEVKIKSVFSTDKQELKDVKAKFIVKDFEAPNVVKVESFGNKLVKVTFSEPVNPDTAKILGNYKIDGKLFSGIVKIDGRVASIEPTNRLSNGEHTMVVNSKVEDFNKFKVLENETKFTVVEDKVKPAVAEVVSASQTKVVIKFTEAVEDTFGVSATSGRYVSKKTNDNITYRIYFDENNALPLSGTELKLTNVKDFSGNTESSITVNVKPTIDLERPEVVSLIQKGQNKIIVEFNKEVRIDTSNDKYTIQVAGKSTTIGHKLPVYFKDDKDKAVKTKVVLETYSNLENKDYIVKVSEVKDLTPLKNVCIPSETSITIVDKLDPKVSKVFRKMNGDKAVIIVEFNEKVSDSTALDYKNYSFVATVDGKSKPISMDSDYTFTMLNDGKTVKIETPKISKMTDVTSVTIMNVTDLAGNKVVPKVATGLNNNSYAAVKFDTTSVKAISVNEIKVMVATTSGVTYAPLDPYKINSNDFKVYYGGNKSDTVSVSGATYGKDDDTKREYVVLKLSSNLSKEAKFNSESVQLEIVATNTLDIYGNAIDSSNKRDGIAVADGIVAEFKGLYSAKATTAGAITIKIEVDEEVVPQSVTNSEAYNLVIDGKVYTVSTVTYSAGSTNSSVPKYIEIKANAHKDVVGKSFTVKYFKNTSGLKDVAGNSLNNFEYTSSFSQDQ